jgi:excisionase family DNA binding protein
LQIGITLDEEAIAVLVTLLRKALSETSSVDEKRKARLRASQHALFSGQTPPDDRGLLIDSREAAKLLKVSERTLWRMWNEGEMPPPIRVGRAVRWSYETLRAWVTAGCPVDKEWNVARK